MKRLWDVNRSCICKRVSAASHTAQAAWTPFCKNMHARSNSGRIDKIFSSVMVADSNPDTGYTAGNEMYQCSSFKHKLTNGLFIAFPVISQLQAIKYPIN
jgi:hypothetical protein